MSQNTITVVGIDVGGKKKGFHAVALCDRKFEPNCSLDPVEIVAWCHVGNAVIIAVDAPCGWSQSGKSRAAERDLRIGGEKVHCFATPTLKIALDNQKGFYDWVFNGERLYSALKKCYSLFDADRRDGPTCIESFPHGMVCALAGKLVPAKPKVQQRRQTLTRQGYDDKALRNIDLVDAALCALAARAFLEGQICKFGQKDEGFIVIPTTKATAQTS